MVVHVITEYVMPEMVNFIFIYWYMYFGIYDVTKILIYGYMGLKELGLYP